MRLTDCLPSADRREYIAAYWILNAEPDTPSSGKRIYADGCADLICNAGNSMAYFYPVEGKEPAIVLHPGKLYLGGTMTSYGVLKTDASCLLTGIRFWPGGFYNVFRQSMQPAVDSTVEFHDDELCPLMQKTENLNARLDQWFSDRKLFTERYDFALLRKRMYESGGVVTVEALADEMCVSIKTLERVFKKNVGIPPKEFLRIIRFQEVLKRLRNAANRDQPGSRESFLQIAFELGYYDHAHLTNEFKKYAGILPSELSNFYKTGIADGQYF